MSDRPRPPRLVAIGDLLLDVVVTPARPLERGTDVPGSVAFRRGGSAANVAAAFVHEGGQAALITSLGREGLARLLTASLRADGVRVHGVGAAGPHPRLAALVDDRGERSFVTQRGAADALTAADLRSSWLRGADVLHVPAYALFAEPIGAAALAAAALARDAGAAISADLSSRRPLLAFGVRRARLRLSELAPSVLFANRDEAGALLGRSGRRAWSGLLAHAPLVVVKDGAWGCRVLWQAASSAPGPQGALAVHQLDVATERLSGLDSTGAGDAFAAGFLHSLLRTGGLRTLTDPALRRAALAGHRAAAVAMRRGRAEIPLG